MNGTDGNVLWFGVVRFDEEITVGSLYFQDYRVSVTIRVGPDPKKVINLKVCEL